MTTTTEVDPYARSAEFYEVMALPHWEMKRGVLISALAAGGEITEPVLDIGAGTGLSTITIADTVPDVAIHAVEPSAAMRAALVSRLLGRGDLIDRVTVHPDHVENIDLPERIGAAVLFGVIGYLDKPSRRRFWEMLRPRLTPRAPVVVEVMAIDQPIALPEMTIAQQRIGNRHNEVRISGQPAGPDAELWTMRYVVSEEDKVITDFTTDHTWHTVGLAELAQEAEAHDMEFQQLHPIIGLLQPR
ncbi:hypothetical protein MSIMFB_05027 [Mycobacterium simulans]|uniref:Methyltransferase type 12 domain-containing protein n=1 Tax=Mycobacterium simulans TaxID=627089 RepID=A0A7Z7NC85_9MYCO|nr:class I SAM-dependent methyltransferase [Mycobacterium simulans]SOJ57549.1 hypothetical protein MSIMFB_05027 [Mycobacterium simulans]SON60311.1 hypothetical protein MSIMFI_01805 [Mycobacterium simulans]